ncbi:MAG TPA: iron-sulfur cluster assembly protein [Candidatus Bathyarchaeia archaeon]|nr:iron-sulfur cluster assembly protein [Candidatus Bathyarchaeia archaeon]
MEDEKDPRLMEKLKSVIDPELGASVVDMGLIKTAKLDQDGNAVVEFVPSSPVCPIAFYLASEIKKKTLEAEGVHKAKVYCREHAMEEAINKQVNTE